MHNSGYSGSDVLTADGCQSVVGELPAAANDCCPIDICNITSGNVMCSFVSLLPNGPLWDRAKEERMTRYYAGPCEPEPRCFSGVCASVVDYAIYSGYRLYYLMRGPLWASLRESSPYSAVETIDSYLSLYGWSNWWESVCRDPRLGPSPLDCDVLEPSINACDANFQPVYIPEIPEELSSAVNRAIAISLHRLQMAPIKNLCGINWVIEPLGAVLRVPPGPGYLDTCGKDMWWEICNLSDTIDSAVGLACNQQDTYPVRAYFEINALEFDTATGTCRATGNQKVRIWPALMAAQAIALSMMPARFCNQPIVRCENVN
jgi:hypothetical protein